MPVDRTSRERIDAMADVSSFTESSCNQVQEILVKSKKSLAKLYATVFPKLPQEKSLGELADAFFVDGNDPLEVLKRPLRRSGALLAFQVMMGHGVKADFDTVSRTLPQAGGAAVDLSQFAKQSKKFARQLIDLAEGTQKGSTPDASAQTVAP